MGEVSEVIRASILRSFTAREVELADPARAASWRWSPGVILFPEGICPWCKENIRSNRIWKVVDRQLVGRWQVLADGSVVRDSKADHPHASGGDRGGNICQGNAESLTAALFLHMNPRDCYWSGNKGRWPGWLQTIWDHECTGLGTPCVGHMDHAVCRAWECPVQWHGGTAGCDCGCYCHPSVSSCVCGCLTCRCPANLAYLARRGLSIPTVDEPASEQPIADVRPATCEICGDSFEDITRSVCCPDMCEGCHDSENEDSDEDSESDEDF